MGLKLEYLPGQTPLEEDEKEGLLIPTITNRGELDEWEQNNIEDAVQWSLSRRIKTEVIFTEDFVKELHRRMYGDVWEWAGQFRQTNKNIGVDKWQIPMALKNLLEDALYWVAEKIFQPDEIAIRFKHRLVSIHCFPNGNGRHSRLLADIIVSRLFSLPEFTWGANGLVKQGDERTAYLSSLRAADAGDFQLLMIFSRS